MNAIVFFVIAFAIILGGFSLIMYLKFKDRLSNSVTFAEMEKCEDEIEKKYSEYVKRYRITKQDGELDAVDIDALTKELHLQVVQDPQLSSVRGVLMASESPEYNGVIRLAANEDKRYSKNFDIMHEIAHYLKDVGVGKRVSTSFARTHHGDPRSHQEQVTDYYAAGMANPKDSLEKRIIACPVDPYSEDFVAKMMEVYNQPNETVRRRINEVIALS